MALGSLATGAVSLVTQVLAERAVREQLKVLAPGVTLESPVKAGKPLSEAPPAGPAVLVKQGQAARAPWTAMK